MAEIMPLMDVFTDEQRLLQQTIRNFVSREVIPQIASCYEQGTFPKEWIQQLAQLGLFGLTLPTEYGGAGADYLAYGLVCNELERGDSGLRSFLSVQNALCIYPIYSFGSAEQKKQFLPDMIAGKRIGCFGLTEPNSGSDPGSMTTFAQKSAGGWLLNGSKTWITNATIADLAIVWAKTDNGVRGFIVERNTPGFTTAEIKHKFSMRASITGELHFQDCFVPEQNLLPGTTKGLSTALSCLTQARYGIAWGAMGAAQSCFDIACSYAKERQQFGKPIASFQLIQNDLVKMYTEIVKAHYLNFHLGQLMNQGKANFAMVSLAKRNACRESLTIARSARNILGANGISLEYHVIRHLTNLETVYTYEGTDNIHTLIIGKELTDVNAFV